MTDHREVPKSYLINGNHKLRLYGWKNKTWPTILGSINLNHTTKNYSSILLKKNFYHRVNSGNKGKASSSKGLANLLWCKLGLNRRLRPQKKGA